LQRGIDAPRIVLGIATLHIVYEPSYYLPKKDQPNIVSSMLSIAPRFTKRQVLFYVFSYSNISSFTNKNAFICSYFERESGRKRI
jgi:hypothetical protein